MTEGQHYATQLGVHDEIARTEALPHWQRFMASLDTLGDSELEQRRREAQRLLRKNGVTYNVYGDAQKLAQPWRLDPIPLLVSSEEWGAIDAGLQQRATVLDLVLQDIYGNQMLLKKGLLPSELVYGHSGFLRPCVGALSRQHRHLTLYAANLVRGANGRMWVLDDRTQAPSGSGYALENRRVMRRVLPDIFRESQVQRLAVFFKALRKELANLAPHNKETPRIVILTPGSLNETYFEHAYLAAYHGFTLVQGDDLTVRDGAVWLKSLEGLQAVDVILRRVDDSFCDPLELNSHSRLGVAGLLEAVRRGNVAIANPLGSSVLENPGLLAFLPRLCRYFLDEELQLPSLATWWCGQARERDFVLHNIDRLVIKPINRSQGDYAIFGGALSATEKDSLRAQIIAKPHAYIGQEQAIFSTLPTLIDQHITPRNAVLRSFAVANGDGYTVMPGGLTRVATQKSAFSVSNQAGGISKDTWVLAAEPDKPDSVWVAPIRPMALFAAPEPLTSRAADNLFWVGRHLERTEAATRLLRIILVKLQETPDYKLPVDAECLTILLQALTQVTGTYPGFIKADSQVLKAPQADLLALAKDRGRTGTLSANIDALVQSANSIRDLWSQDTWRSIDNIRRRWHTRVINADCTVEHLQTQLDDLLTGVVVFTGLTSETMTREAAWLMLDSGRRLERALALVALLRATLVHKQADAVQTQVLECVLQVTDSLSLYQRRYRAAMHLSMVLELLVFDVTHPRSLAYQLHQLTEHFRLLPKDDGNHQLSSCERLILQAYTGVRLSQSPELAHIETEAYVYAGLEQLLSDTGDLLWQLADTIAQSYFSHAQSSHLLILSSQDEEL
jgi:uncharacterized circularly permuted ATP-grasp superfamily protein/uncharacterized alpha-E superfamily protein